MTPDQIRYRLELDMRYGNQRVQTAVVTELSRLRKQRDVLMLMDQFYQRYGARFGDASQSPEAEKPRSKRRGILARASAPALLARAQLNVRPSSAPATAAPAH